MSVLSDRALKLLQCAVSNDKHIVCEPVCLCCGHSVCRKCFKDDEQEIQCKECDKVSKIKFKIFDDSPAVNYIIDENISNLFTVLEERFERGVSSLKESKIVFEEFLDLKVDCAREVFEMKIESMKIELDQIYDQLSKQLMEYKKKVLESKAECFTKIKDTELFEKSLANLKNDIENKNVQSKELFYTYQETLKEITKKQTELQNYKYHISFMDKGLKIDLSSFGELKLLLPRDVFEIPSNILKDKEKDTLFQFMRSEQMKWSLLYRATRDGFSSSYFHQRCDCANNTLTIVKSTNGNIFGGYTSENWASYNYMNNRRGLVYENQYSQNLKKDNNAFIFSLKNQFNNPFKAHILPDIDAIKCNQQYGPCFGNEIMINLNSTCGSSTVLTSYSSFGISELILAQPFAGSNNFNIVDVEVFVLNSNS